VQAAEGGAVATDKAVQKQIDRLNKAREEKERTKMYTERGAMPPIKQPADLVNVSTISATSKKPTQAAQQQQLAQQQQVQNRRSPYGNGVQSKIGAGSNHAPAYNRAKHDAHQLEMNAPNSIFHDNIAHSPEQEGYGEEEQNLHFAGAEGNQVRDSAQKSSVSDRTPLLFVDVNLGGEASERIVVYEGDTARELALRFCEEHNLDEDTLEKLEELLVAQISTVLTKIDEEGEHDSNLYSQNDNE
jgi:hypothetical protein